MIESEFISYSLAILGAFLAGIINTFAGNGSAITLTILTELLGLAPNLANGTNRVGVFAQTMSGSFSFYKNGKLNLQRSKWIIIFTFIGAIIGVLVATKVSNEQFKFVFRALLCVMFVVILFKPKRFLRETDEFYNLPIYISMPLFLALGFYGGFIQMGMGIIFLASMVLIARINIVETNAVKTFVVFLYTIVILFIFQYHGLIDWKFGLLLAVGQIIGGYLGAEYLSNYKSAEIWAYRLLVAIVSFAIIKMLIEFLA